ncbi:6-pyruvoyl trahydropterin synthase family protein [Halopelagius longus]|uniref:6-pyruvoyl tetrahydropterin synthase family protein n=1 Tax=Halopelagius longus TaxID=1236180 RepID=A0A1H1A8N5_9EURY|nr:6-pyruvoyl tetrahydropterin synthase family protein [Halopelagius longus]RDI70283.1 6-pyruvoyl tetrahydropterin synthase family protein [Halopelagius longus]SDQ36085.1 6-pyruvoyltetrahydropterin/6-carboxytetrahydropterin synthase [Halopelagius longus]
MTGRAPQSSRTDVPGADGGDADSPVARAGERVLRIGSDRPVRISAGHRLLHHDGKCSRPHGHNYEISVELVGELTEEGWVADKGDVTDVIDEWDHMFLLESGDPLLDAFEESDDADAAVVLDAPPTAEVMAVVLEEKLADALPDTVSEVAVEVRETSELCTGFR